MSAPPYDTCNTVLNTARTRANDAIASLSGDVLTNTQPFTQTVFNSAFRRMQDTLANLGYTRLTRFALVEGITATAATDPAVECWIDWSGYYNGSVLNSALVLPQDLIFPIRVWERINGQNMPFPRRQMENMVDGLLCPWPQNQIYNNQWTWREDKLRFPGSLSTEDFRIEYGAYLPDMNTLSGVAITAASKTNPCNITSTGSGVISGETITISGATGTGWTNLNAAWVVTVIDENTFSIPLDTSAYTGTVGGSPVLASVTWYSRPVPIMRCLDALSWYIVYEVANARGDEQSSAILTMAEAAARLVMNRDIRQKQRVNVRRLSRSGRLEGTSAFYGPGVN